MKWKAWNARGTCSTQATFSIYHAVWYIRQEPREMDCRHILRLGSWKTTWQWGGDFASDIQCHQDPEGAMLTRLLQATCTAEEGGTSCDGCNGGCNGSCNSGCNACCSTSCSPICDSGCNCACTSGCDSSCNTGCTSSCDVCGPVAPTPPPTQSPTLQPTRQPEPCQSINIESACGGLVTEVYTGLYTLADESFTCRNDNMIDGSPLYVKPYFNGTHNGTDVLYCGKVGGTGDPHWLLVDAEIFFCENLPFASAIFAASPFSPHMEQKDSEVRCAEVWGPGELLPRLLKIVCEDPTAAPVVTRVDAPVPSSVKWFRSLSMIVMNLVLMTTLVFFV